MLATSRDVRPNGAPITADNYIFDTVKEFVYIGSAVTTKTGDQTQGHSCQQVLLWSQWAIE